MQIDYENAFYLLMGLLLGASLTVLGMVSLVQATKTKT